MGFPVISFHVLAESLLQFLGAAMHAATQWALGQGGKPPLDEMKQTVNSQNRSLEFLEELAEGANDYAALFNPEHKKWNEYGTSTKKHLATIIKDLRVKQIRPLMFAVLRKFSVKEAKLAFRLFVFWSVRFLIYGGRGGLLDRNYALRAQKIGKAEITTAKELTAECICLA